MKYKHQNFRFEIVVLADASDYYIRLYGLCLLL